MPIITYIILIYYLYSFYHFTHYKVCIIMKYKLALINGT